MNEAKEAEVHSYGGKTFVVPAFTAARKDGLVLSPRGEVSGQVVRAPPERKIEGGVGGGRGDSQREDGHCVRWLSPAEVLQGLSNVWKVDEFESVHPPMVVAKLSKDKERWAYYQPGAFPIQRILDMPIKFPGCNDYRLPAELQALAPLLQKVIDFEHEVNEKALDSYCYLTLDQGIVPAGCMQRNEGCHTDGFQGARITPKLQSDHAYVVSNALPTVFYLQPFEVKHLDPAKHNFFLDFDRQAMEENAWRAEPFEVVLMDAFSVHRGEKATVDTFRTFVRLSYTVRVFDRLGNAHNPMFDYAWDMVPRDTQSTLATYRPPPPCRPASSFEEECSSHSRRE